MNMNYEHCELCGCTISCIMYMYAWNKYDTELIQFFAMLLVYSREPNDEHLISNENTVCH